MPIEVNIHNIDQDQNGGTAMRCIKCQMMMIRCVSCSREVCPACHQDCGGEKGTVDLRYEEFRKNG
jgi:hypothetical protein